jgi:DNA-directed RNA polymerase specialized sigma24 family protein
MEGLAYVDATAPARDDVFAATVGQHYPGLVRRLTAVLGDHEAALDVAQEAYLRAYRAWDRSTSHCRARNICQTWSVVRMA